jgi:hypothetical protein
VLECPCNGRFGGDPQFYPTEQTKVLSRSITAIPSGSCSKGQDFSNAQACYDAVAELGFNATAVSNKTGSDTSLPAGCSFVKNGADGTGTDGTGTAMFNTGTGSASGAAASATMGAASTSAVTGVTMQLTTVETVAKAMTRGPKGKYCEDNKVGVIMDFHAKTASAADATAALDACEAFCMANARCHACSVDLE